MIGILRLKILNKPIASVKVNNSFKSAFIQMIKTFLFFEFFTFLAFFYLCFFIVALGYILKKA